MMMRYSRYAGGIIGSLSFWPVAVHICAILFVDDVLLNDFILGWTALSDCMSAPSLSVSTLNSMHYFPFIMFVRLDKSEGNTALTTIPEEAGGDECGLDPE